jgi:hypothetical protein
MRPRVAPTLVVNTSSSVEYDKGMASDLNEKQRREALVADIIAVVKSTKDRWFYTGIVDRIPELHIRAVLKKIQTEPERAIGHPGAYFFNEIVSFAETLGIELPEPVNNDCAVPLYQDGRSGSEPTPFLCLPHMAEFQHFKPEKLYEEAGIVVYDYEVREPWLQSLSYEDWRMYVFIHEKEVDALLHDPYMEKYFPPE